MGWPTKGSGKSYNSDAGFGVCVGSYSKKVLSSLIFCRACRICDMTASRNQRNVTDVPVQQQKHECMKNCSGSIKSMEAAAILQMVQDSIALGFIVGSIVSDDDSVMRAHLHHNMLGL